MEEPNTTRKLRAIMFSDIVGYTKMMQNNEAEALKLLQKHKDIVTEISAKYGGKIIKHIGDEILVESESAVMLVYCAKELQKYFADRNTTVPKSRELWVRIGIHIGDVIIKEDDIFGDGVNIASRIRPLADPGGIVITHSVLILLGNQDDIKCEFMGNKRLKNIKEKVKVYEVKPDSSGMPDLGLGGKRRMDMETLLKVVLPVFASVLLLIIIVFLLFFDHYTDYEEHYFRSEFSAARAITKSIRSEKNLKSNYYNIMSADSEEKNEILNYYSEMHSKDADNPKTCFYLALSYLKFHTDRNQLDSAYILMKKASGSQINSLYFKLAEADLHTRLKLRSACGETAGQLLKEYPEHPLALIKSADILSGLLKRPDEAVVSYRKALSVFPQSVEALNGLAMIEYNRSDYERARSISDSALAINPGSKKTIETAILIRKNLSDLSDARDILSNLSDESALKYREEAEISLMENDPATALDHISNGLTVFPNRTEFVRLLYEIQEIIAVSDSIQKKENSVSRAKQKRYTSWDEAVQASVKEQKPLIITALDDEKLQSKYLELALLNSSVIKTAADAVLLTIHRHRDRPLAESLKIDHYPALIWVNTSKEQIRTFSNREGNIKDPEIVRSFITESVQLNSRMNSMIKETELNKVKNAKNFSHAEELALEFEMPVMVVMSDRNHVGSETYMKHTVLNPGFIKNYRNMIFLSLEDMAKNDLAAKYKITRFPAVLFFDEDINLISVKYGTMPQKILEKEINKVKLFRKRKDVLKEEINWLYDPKEAYFYSKTFSKPILAYYSSDSQGQLQPEEDMLNDYSVIKKINSSYIPLFVRKPEDIKAKPSGHPVLAVMNSFGDILYDTLLPDDAHTLSIFLDYRINSEIYLNYGCEGYKDLLGRYETVRSLLSNKLKHSAKHELLDFITKYPSYPYAFIDIGRYFLDNNDFTKSTHYIRLLQDSDFDISDNFLKVIVSGFSLYDDIFMLNEILNKLISANKKNITVASNLYAAQAEINMAEANTLEAIAYADSAYALDPKRTENLTLLGILNYGINAKKSEDYFLAALVLDPDNLVANSYMFKLRSEDKYSVAARRSYHSGNTDFTGLRYFDTAKYFSSKGLVEVRERSYRIRLSLFPENPDFMLDLAKFITESNGNLVEALEVTGKLLARSPGNPDYLSAAAWVSYCLGDFSGADKLITKALVNLSPDEFYKYPELFYNIGMIKSAIGDNRSAAYYFETLVGFRNKNDIDHAKLNYAERFLDSIH